jgi:hypothetical protein
MKNQHLKMGPPATFSVGPLMTAFKPAASCLSALFQDFALKQAHLPHELACLPFAFTGGGYYSPAICPDGYMTAWVSSSSADAGEATVECFPR